MHRWAAGNNAPLSCCSCALIVSLFLVALGFQPIWAKELEPGGGRVRFLQGMQNTGFGFKSFKYLGLGFDLEQNTLNYGKWRANFLGLGDDWGQQQQLGYATLGVRNLWLRDGLEGDFFLGDGYLETGLPVLPFEHFVVPSQNFRGLGSHVYNTKYAVFVYGGILTFLSFQFPEALVNSDTRLVGFFCRLGELDKAHGGIGADGFSDPQGKRYLLNCYLDYPLNGPVVRALGWYDSRSGKPAGVIGIRQPKTKHQWEVGASYVPFDFVYLSENATLTSGQALGFGTYRRMGLLWNYYVQGSAGQLSFGQGANSWLVQGSAGGSWRFRLRDTLSASMGFSWMGGGQSGDQLHLLPSLSYSHTKGSTNYYVQIMSDYYTTRLTTQGQAVVVQPGFLGEVPETEETRIIRYSLNAGFDSSKPSGTRWGGNLRLDATRTEGNQVSSQFSSFQTATAELRLGRYLPFDLNMDLSVRSGLTFNQGSTTGVHGGSLRLNLTRFQDWLIYIEGKFYWSQLPQEFTSFFTVPNPAYEIRSGMERRFYWGESAPVYGVYSTTGFKGVGMLSGRVFEDRNRNGVFDAGDIPLKEAVLRLDEGFVVETNYRGEYAYPNVASGEHTLQLDPESYPVRLTSKHPEGFTFNMRPREDRLVDWPLVGN